jgi:transcription-repair coupling factor (superfamily II helicase)
VQAIDLVSLYTRNGYIQNLVKQITKSPATSVHIKGLAGSLPAILGSAFYKLADCTQVFILQDKEEAAYLYTDLQNLFTSKQVLLYPAIDQQPDAKSTLATTYNLIRNEILQQLSQQEARPQLIVTYPEAIITQVIGPNRLIENTWSIQISESLALTDIIDKLDKRGFERVDFVYEAGQFAVRGGIIDIFSYANQLPYRIELFGKEIESIRTFNPANQLSTRNVETAFIFSYDQTSGKEDNYQSFLTFLPANTCIWFKDYELVRNTIKIHNEKIQVDVKEEQPTNNTNLITNTSGIVYENIKNWEKTIQQFTCIEFGNRIHVEAQEIVEYRSSPQPNLNQQFKLLADNLYQNHKLGLANFIVSESPGQLEKISNILAELEVPLNYKTLVLGLSQGFIDQQVGIACYTDHQIFSRYYRYKSPQQYTKSQAFTLKELNNLQTGDYVVHIDYGIARFAGLSRVHVNDKEQEVLRLVYKDNDVVYLSLHSLHKISKYTGKEGFVPAMSKLGSVAWEQKKKRVKHKVQDIAKELIQLYGKRKHAPGFAFSPDNFLQAELESSFMYEDTPDQAAATADVKKDMEVPHPMDRLVCGDVGFGKTEVAIRAAFKAVQDLKQVAVLVPTTILALQHYESFKSRFANFPVRIQYINRFKSQQEISQIRQEVTQGKIDILIGTHAILSKSFSFHDLGLLVVDEEQKFGVKAKERIKELKVNVDVLTLTATPIPRTLHFSLMGARDLSVIATPPPNRQPVQTSIHTFDKKVIQEAIHYEVQRGGQVFFVHNRVGNIEEVANMLHKLAPEYRIGIAHGQMDGDQLEKRMLTFISGGYDILVSTNIIESGLDIPNANTIIINDSHMFGLSDLHQMRGRVGRSNKKAFCYLIAPPSSSLTAEARKRLSTLEEFTELGDGFKVAMRDLDIRGAGNLLGAEQSGFITDVGFEAYCKILDEAVQELKENEFKELFAEELARKGQLGNIDCTLETDLELLIPATYISNDTERLRLYTKLDSADDDAALKELQKEIEDRFGLLPMQVQELIKAVKLRWLARKLRLQKIKLKEGMMGCYFIASQQKSDFSEMLTRILSYIQKNPQKCQLKELKNQLMLSVNNIHSVEEAQQVLEAIVS